MKDVVVLDKGGIVIEKVIFKDTGELSFQVGIIQLEGMEIFVQREEITCLRRHLELMFLQCPFFAARNVRVSAFLRSGEKPIFFSDRVPFSVREGETFIFYKPQENLEVFFYTPKVIFFSDTVTVLLMIILKNI